MKISSFKTGADDQEILFAFANKVSANLGEKGALPPILTAFPKEGKVTTQKNSFQKSFLATLFYTQPSPLITHSLVRNLGSLYRDGDPRGMSKYDSDISGADRENLRAKVAEGRHTYLDPHHGEIDLYWRGGNIWGILNLNDPSVRSKYLKLLEEGLKKSKKWKSRILRNSELRVRSSGFRPRLKCPF